MNKLETVKKIVAETKFNIPYIEFLNFLDYSNIIKTKTYITFDNNIGVISGNIIINSYLVPCEVAVGVFDIDMETLIDIPISELDNEYNSNYIIDRILNEYGDVSRVNEEYSKYILYKRKIILDRVI